VEERVWKACECLAEKWYHKASEECWELTVIKMMENQAAEERELQEHTEKAYMEATHKAAKEKAAREQAEAAQKAVEAKKAEGLKGKGPVEASKSPVKVS
jgi:hypothetical protein